MTGSIFGFSLPNFWLGLMLILAFAVELKVLPAGGRGDTGELLGIQWSFLTIDGLRHLITELRPAAQDSRHLDRCYLDEETKEREAARLLETMTAEAPV